MTMFDSGVGVSPRSPITARFVAISVLRRAFALCVFALLAGAVTVTILLLRHREFTSTASFTPQGRRAPGGGNLTGLAAQIGIALPTNDAAESPEFYADLLQTPELLGPLVDARFKDELRPDSVEKTLA